jgi:signal transduction histidine kinase
MTADVLRGQGYTVLTASSPGDARDYLHGEAFDLVLLDLRLARSVGRALLSELSRYPSQTVAVVLTGEASAVSLVDAVRAGAYDYLVQPLDPEVLKVAAARAIERATLARGLRELLEERGERVERATAELRAKVRELDEAKHQLEEAHRQREESIALIAHDLAGPLTAIAGYAQLLGRPKVTPEVRERTRTVLLAETRRITRLVEDLSHGGPVAGDQFQLQPVVCDLAEIARVQVELARHQTARHTVHFEAAGRLSALCDPDRVGQVLSNLLANARKYTPGGAIRVRAWAENGHLRLSVSDAGPGIPPDRLEAIFAPRVRLAAGTTAGREPKGAGLGLYIAKGIVEAHGGQIWVESTLGQGATFHVRLPRTRAPGAGRGGPRPSQPALFLSRTCAGDWPPRPAGGNRSKSPVERVGRRA